MTDIPPADAMREALEEIRAMVAEPYHSRPNILLRIDLALSAARTDRDGVIDLMCGTGSLLAKRIRSLKGK